jgi:hypothetical protein
MGREDQREVFGAVTETGSSEQCGSVGVEGCHDGPAVGSEPAHRVRRYARRSSSWTRKWKTARSCQNYGTSDAVGRFTRRAGPRRRAGTGMTVCLTPTSASWANPTEPQFRPLRTFTMASSNPANHPALTRDLQAYLCWRNANTRPDVLAAQRGERARIRSERQQCWGRPRPKAA